jgi:hypothetical protein
MQVLSRHYLEVFFSIITMQHDGNMKSITLASCEQRVELISSCVNIYNCLAKICMEVSCSGWHTICKSILLQNPKIQKGSIGKDVFIRMSYRTISQIAFLQNYSVLENIIISQLIKQK